MKTNRCDLCPRECQTDRNASVGFCGAPNKIIIAKSMLHYFEEPVISGENGSGAIFFGGCNLKCRFCQNKDISSTCIGKEYSEDEFVNLLFDLEKQGANNINLITATPYVDLILPSLIKFKSKSKLPIVYNSSGYEKVETLKKLDGVVDVYLPDYKYYSSDLAEKFSMAKNYPSVTKSAIAEMVRQQGKCVIENDLIKKGVIVRHLVLPSHVDDSIEIMKDIAKNFPQVLVSVMSQYTPDFADDKYKELKRRLTSFEYGKVMKAVEELELDGFCQERSSASKVFTPDFTQ